MPRFTFKSPQGESFTINGPDGATPEQAFGVLQQHLTNLKSQGVTPISTKDIDTAQLEKQKNIVGTPNFDPTRDPTDAEGNTIKSDPLTPFKAAVGAGETVLSGVTGGAGSLADAMTGAEPGSHDWAYRPRTVMGKDISGAIGKGVSAAGNAALDVIAPPENGYESPLHQTLAERVPQAVGAVGTAVPALKIAGGVASAAARTAVGESAGEAPAALPGPTPLQRVQAAGYQIRPSDVPARNPTVEPGAVPGSLREALTSSPQQTEGMVRNNAAVSTRLAGEEIGVPNATKLTEPHFQAAEQAPAAVYDSTGQAIGQLHDVQGSTIDNLRAVATDQTPQGAVPATARTQLNRMIEGLKSGQYQGPQLIRDISYLRNEVGGAGGRAAADVLEGEMEHQLEGQPETLAGFQAARTQFAKIRNVRDATTGGLVDAAEFRRLSENNPGLLTGNLATIAEAGGEIPHLTRLPRPTADQTPVAGTAFKTVANAAARGVARLPFMDITNPALQERIAASAPPAGPLPNPAGLSRTAAPAPPVMGAPPGSVGVAPRQLGLELAPGAPPAPPAGEAFGPAQRGMTLPQGRSPIDLSRQILRQIRLRNGQLPGTLDNGG